MQKDKIQLEDIGGTIAASGQAIIKPPRGLRYHDLTLIFGNTAAGDANAPASVGAILSNLIVRYGGEEIINIDAGRLDTIQTFQDSRMASQGYAGVANGSGRRHLTIFFADPSEDADRGSSTGVVSDREILALPTDWLSAAGSLQILVKFVAGITPALTASATVDSFGTGQPVPVMKYQEHPSNVSAASITLVNTLPRTGLLAHLALFDTSDGKTVENVLLKMGRVPKWDLPKNENTTKNLFNRLNPQAGAYHMPFGAHNGIADYFDPNQPGDMSIKADFSAAANGSFTIVSKRYEMPSGK